MIYYDQDKSYRIILFWIIQTRVAFVVGLLIVKISVLTAQNLKLNRGRFESSNQN